jgi:hypothetical protein
VRRRRVPRRTSAAAAAFEIDPCERVGKTLFATFDGAHAVKVRDELVPKVT